MPIADTCAIDRAHYLALRTPEPEAAARFAAEHLGLDLVHVDGEGRHYLAAAGLDPYSLIYVPGEDGVDHVSYVVPDLAALAQAQQALDARGVEHRRVEQSGLWRHGPAVRFPTPAGIEIELTVGVRVEVPMVHLTPRPSAAPAPISCDHVVVRALDVDSELAFAAGPMGLRESGRIEAPGVGPVLTFMRSHTLYHCFAVAQGAGDGLHHFQLSVKDRPALFAAYEAMRDGGAVDVLWGPVRHGPGHNVAFYVRDYAGNVIEYSAEEEIVLDNDSYVAQAWSAADQSTMDEWGTRPPDGLL
jgi:catechol 2,3-dioxygenase